jgi:hypothetical protein
VAGNFSGAARSDISGESLSIEHPGTTIRTSGLARRESAPARPSRSSRQLADEQDVIVMANTIGSLIIDLVANTASFTTTLNKAVSDVEHAVLKMKTAFGSLAEVFTIAGIAELTKSTLEFGDQLEKSAIKTGNSAQAISELAFAARQVNIDLPELTSSFEKMERAISTAGTGNAQTKAAFDALGISFAQIKQLSPDQQFEEIANQISKLPDPTDRARASIAIFGRAGAELLPLFEQGAAGIELARQKAIEFGASLDAEQLKKMADASTAVKDLGESFRSFATAGVANVAQPLKSLFDSLTQYARGNNPIEAVSDELRDLESLLAGAKLFSGEDSATVKRLEALIATAETELTALNSSKSLLTALKELNDGSDWNGKGGPSKPPGFLADIKPIEINPNLKLHVDSMRTFYEQLDETTQTGGEKLLTDTAKLQAELDVLVKSGVITLSDSLQREFAGDNAKASAGFFTANAADISAAFKQTQDDLTENFAGIAAKAKLMGDLMRADFDKTRAIYVQGAQSMEDSFATFLVDPFAGGLKKMLVSWIQTIDQMVARAAAAQLFKSLFGSTGVSGADGLGGFFQSLFRGGSPASSSTGLTGFDGSEGYATGGAFTVGGAGGTDSQMVKFKATPGERVTIQTPGQQASGAGIALYQTVNIDARTDSAQISQLVKESTQIAIQQSKAWVVDRVRRGAFQQ